MAAAARRLREERYLRGKQSEGWLDWKKAMVPPGDKSENLERRGRFQVGKMCSNIKNAYPDFCGIYEWKAKGTRDGQKDYIVYVGSTCPNSENKKLRSRIIGYCKNGNHKRKLINKALRRGYEMWVHVKKAGSEEDAQNEENALLENYDYAWNKRQNGGLNGIRDIPPKAAKPNKKDKK